MNEANNLSELKELIIKNYNIDVLDIIKSNTSSKIMKVITIKDEYIIKQCDSTFEQKVNYLKSENVNNIIYPIKNKQGKYVSIFDERYYYLQDFHKNSAEIKEVKARNLLYQLNILHQQTKFRKSLSPTKSKKKLEEIFNYLQYKFNLLETFVRKVESEKYDEYSIMILKGYHHILDAKKIMGELNKKIIEAVKEKISVDYVFLHGNPKSNHLVNDNGYYFISYQNGFYGICSLDIAKYYIEIEDLNLNHYELIKDYFKEYDNDFYYNYFLFLVLLYYIKSIIIYDKDYVSSQSFVYAANSIKKFLNIFIDK